MKNAVLINKRANKSRESIKEIRKYLNNDDTYIYYIKNPRKMHKLTNKIIEQSPERIIVGGGDGTINAIAHKIAATNIKLAVIPMGTANDFARTMNIPSSLKEASEISLGNKSKKIDIGTVEKNVSNVWSQNRHLNYFVNVATIGIGSRIPLEMNTRLKRITGAFAYRVASLTAFFKFKNFDVKITFLDENNKVVNHNNVFHIAIGNGKYYGGGMLVSDNADITSHQFDLYVAEAHSFIDIFQILRHIKKGELARASNVTHYQTKRFYIETNTKYPINLDGEIMSHTPAYFAIQENAIEVIIK